MKRKGQAAMEFLMTYGWAILAAIVVIGVMAIWFNPSQLGGGTSYINTPLHLVSEGVRNVTTLQLEVRNDAVSGITVWSVVVDGTSPDITCTYTGTQAVGVGSSNVFDATCASALTAGGDYAGDVKVTYLVDGTSINATTTGKFFGTVP